MFHCILFLNKQTYLNMREKIIMRSIVIVNHMMCCIQSQHYYYNVGQNNHNQIHPSDIGDHKIFFIIMIINNIKIL